MNWMRAHATFESERGRLMALAYRMLGVWGDAEELVQDAWIKWRLLPPATRLGIQNTSAYLTSMVARLCIDRLRHRRVTQLNYVGPWLPEPIADETDPAVTLLQAESVQMAMLCVLETLNPLQRAVLILHEVFDYSHGEIAKLLNIEAAHSRQALRRAKLATAKVEPQTGSEQDKVPQLVEAFQSAAQSGDHNALAQLLCEDVVAYTDGGGRASAALVPLDGRDKVTTVFAHLVRANAAELSIDYQRVNGQQALVIRSGEGMHSVCLLNLYKGKVHRVYVMRNPAKLTTFEIA